MARATPWQTSGAPLWFAAGDGSDDRGDDFVSDESAGRTYHPEYAGLRKKEKGGYHGRCCPECGKLASEYGPAIATRVEEDEYLLWEVWYCSDCDLNWRAPEKPVLNLFRQRTSKPGLFGNEVVGDER